MSLAAAVALVGIDYDAFYALSIYFLIFIVWSAVSIVRRSKLKSNTVENVERLRRRYGWLIVFFSVVLHVF